MVYEDAATCKSCVFRLRFGFRRALFMQLYLANEALVAFARKLDIKGDADVARMMHVFLRVDAKGTYKLEIDTFFQYFDIEFTEYNKRAFRLLAAFGDKEDIPSGNGSSNGRGRLLTFDHFFVSMYNYGTLTHEALVRFAFDIMAYGKDFCNKQDVMELSSLLHSDSGRVKETTHSLMAIMDPHNRNKIPFSTFRKEERRLQSMLFPAFKLQKILRAKVLGQRYWRRATEKRRKNSLLGADLRQEFMRLKEEQVMRKQQLGAGSGEGVRGVVLKKKNSNLGGGESRSAVEGDRAEAGWTQAETAELESALKHDPAKTTVTISADEDERYGARASGESTESQNSSNLSSDSEFDEQAHQMSQRVSFETTAGREGARMTPYIAQAVAPPPAAAAIRSSGTISDAMANKEQGDGSMMRRATASKASVDRRRSDAHTLRDDGTRSPRRLSSSMMRGGRRRTASLEKASLHAVPGRRGSMFEDMQIFEPSLPSVGGGRRASEKTSRVTPESH